MKVLQTSALPLGYTAIILLSVYKVNYRTGVAGFEPTHEGVKVPCLNRWAYTPKIGRANGWEIEPRMPEPTIPVREPLRHNRHGQGQQGIEPH